MTAPNFARQLAEYRRDAHANAQQPPTKRFRSSAAPKGTKLPSGYQDRAQQRQTQDGDAGEAGSGTGTGMDLEQRVAALEGLVKEGKIDQATFDRLRGELGVGGDVKSTHMVKGLDWDLLRRVKAGKDVSKQKAAEPEESGPEESSGQPEEDVDLDAEFDRVTEEKGQEKVESTAPTTKEQQQKKKGTMAPPPPPKKSRNEILKELKASRAAAAAPAESTLGSKFKKLGDSTKPEKNRWVEQDENGRRKEILAITDAQGNTKRKTRWLDKPGEPTGLLMPATDAKPLGMDVPAGVAATAEDEDEDEDIFQGVGADYNPLAGLDEGSSSDDSDEEGQVPGSAAKKPTEPPQPSAAAAAAAAAEPSRPRNYFSTRNEPTVEEDQARVNPLAHDPSLLAAFKRAAALRQADERNDNQEDHKDDNHGQRFLDEMRRREAQDAMDMDLGFGGSRVEDDQEEEPVVLEGEGTSRGGNKRKRGPKKRKGDKDNASDVMKVMEARK